MERNIRGIVLGYLRLACSSVSYRDCEDSLARILGDGDTEKGRKIIDTIVLSAEKEVKKDR